MLYAANANFFESKDETDTQMEEILKINWKFEKENELMKQNLQDKGNN